MTKKNKKDVVKQRQPKEQKSIKPLIEVVGQAFIAGFTYEGVKSFIDTPSKEMTIGLAVVFTLLLMGAVNIKRIK